MSTTVDNLLAFRILYLLTQPFEESDAFRLGIIDKSGKALRRSSTFKTDAEYSSYTALHRLVFNLKKLLGKLPGGETQLASITAAYFLIKESLESGEEIQEEQLVKLIPIYESGITTEDTELVKNFIAEEGVIANVTGPAIANSEKPLTKIVKRKNKMKSFKDYVTESESTHFLKNLTTGHIVSRHTSEESAQQNLDSHQKRNPDHKFKVVKSVEEETLDELSIDTLASYKKKAGEDARGQDNKADSARYVFDKEAVKKHTEKANKRMRGINKATIKQFKEFVEESK